MHLPLGGHVHRRCRSSCHKKKPLAGARCPFYSASENTPAAARTGAGVLRELAREGHAPKGRRGEGRGVGLLLLRHRRRVARVEGVETEEHDSPAARRTVSKRARTR